jgi:hypothetical protein
MKLELGIIGDEEFETDERDPGIRNWVLQIRRWIRLNFGGLLWFVVGAYLFWMLLHMTAGLKPSSRLRTEKPIWPDTRYMFVL